MTLRSLPEGATEADRPLCKCHAEPMRWNTGRRTWLCSVKAREASRRFYMTEKGREAYLRELHRRQTKGLSKRERLYRASERGREKAREADRRWREAHRDLVQEKGRQYRAKNMERLRVDARNRARIQRIRSRHQRVLLDPLSRRLCFPAVDVLVRRYKKVAALVEQGVAGEQESAKRKIAFLYAELQDRLSKIEGGLMCLDSLTTRAGTPSMPPATSSPRALAA